MKNFKLLLSITSILIIISLNSCKKDNEEVYKCRVINAITKEPISNYPVKFMFEIGSIFGSSYSLIEEKRTDQFGYVSFVKEKYKSKSYIDSEPNYVLESGYTEDRLKDTVNRFFDEMVNANKNGEATIECNPRGLIYISIDLNSFPLTITSAEISTKYESKSINNYEFNRGIRFYTTANRVTEFKFKLKSQFVDTLITRNVYVKDYLNLDGSGSTSSYILSK